MNYLTYALNTVKDHSKITYYHSLFALALAAICLGGMLIDERTLMGVNVWLKPLKFCISTLIYLMTIGFFTHLYKYGKRKKNFINHLVSWTLSVELLIIVGQGARGVQSHYNMSSPMDGILFAAMGILVAVNVLVMVMFLIDTLRNKPQLGYTLLGGLLVAWIAILYGSSVGGQMISQMSHNVGVVDGGKGLPLVNWSLSGGDLRIAHFFGIHAIQIIPLVVFQFTKRFHASPLKAGLLSAVFSLAYVGMMGLTFYQAKHGIPLLALSLS